MAKAIRLPAGYRRRVVDSELDELMQQLPAISLEGPKGTGKTSTARQRSRTYRELDHGPTRELIQADLGRLVTGPEPIVIDEWQRFPDSWDVVRRAVDEDPRPGRFLLTGSASLESPPTHSGAGRIVRVRMRPMALVERDVEVPTVSLAELLTGSRPEIGGSTKVMLEDYANEIVVGGFPAMRLSPGRAQRAAVQGYLQRVIDQDFEQAGHPIRNPAALHRWMTAFAAAVGTTTSYERIRDAATGGHGEKPAKTTTIPYRDTLERLWIVDEVPAWSPTSNHLTRLSSSPKRHLADPCLAAGLLGVGAEALLEGHPGGVQMLRDGTLLGKLFESLVALDVRVYAQSAEAQVCHLRRHNGDHEIDLIVVRPDQRVVALEVKLSQTVADDDVKHLLWLRREIGDELLDAVIVTTGSEAYRRRDGIAVVPAALLGA